VADRARETELLALTDECTVGWNSVRTFGFGAGTMKIPEACEEMIRWVYRPLANDRRVSEGARRAAEYRWAAQRWSALMAMVTWWEGSTWLRVVYWLESWGNCSILTLQWAINFIYSNWNLPYTLDTFVLKTLFCKGLDFGSVSYKFINLCEVYDFKSWDLNNWVTQFWNRINFFRSLVTWPWNLQ